MPRPTSKFRRNSDAMIARRERIASQRFASPPLIEPVDIAGREHVSVDATSTTPHTTATRTQVTSGPPTSGITQPELLTLPRPPFAVRVLNHLTFGATAASIAEFNALGSSDNARLTAFVDQQLNPAAINDSALDTRLTSASYITLDKTLTQLWADYRIITTDSMRPSREVQRAAVVRAVYSRRQLQETMVGFWQNHFNVTISNTSAGPVYAHYNRDVLRANAFGNFRTMLEAVAQSTAMLYYLNNASNSRSGPNENFARELLELHTFGTENYLGFVRPPSVPPAPEDPAYPIGYTDLDVYDTAAAFTGWTVKDGRNGFPTENDGTFVYRQAMHDAGPKQVLGLYIDPEQGELKDGRDILDRVANHPRVAKYICKKLIRRFVSDKPDQALIDSAALIFRQNWQNPDQIKLTLRHILLSNAFIYSWGQKNRRPFELIAGALRAMGSDWTVKGVSDDTRSNDFMSRLATTGHTPYDWPAPNGYPDVGVTWSSSNNLVTTWKMLSWLTEATDNTVPLIPILDASRSSVSSWTANNLVDFWCQRILGYLPTAARRQALVSFMAQNGDPATYVITDTDAAATTDLKRHYNQQRLRSMVSLILISPEFMSR